MKRLILAALCCISLCISAQEETIGSFFKNMPDTLMPYLSHNNRLDMIDFMEAQMKAEVTNLMGGKSEMTSLTADSLSIRMNVMLQVDMKLTTPEQPSDSSRHVISLWRTYTLNGQLDERIHDVYTTDWHLLSSRVERSTLLRRDEKIRQDKK